MTEIGTEAGRQDAMPRGVPVSWRVAGAYLAGGVVWAVLAEHLGSLLAPGGLAAITARLAWAMVLVVFSAAMVFGLVEHDRRARRRSADLLRAKHVELLRAYDGTIEGWSRALDLRDRETEGHSARVTELTVRLCRALGMGAADLVDVRRGALLHDIGKLGIPDSILRKPGPLDEREWALMRRHPELACQLLAPIEFLASALDIPRYHHERWDGSGYPLGLSGDDIPLAARAFAVVDVYDALRSDRPYRRGWLEVRVRDHLSEQAGAQLDAVAVRTFLGLLADDDTARTGTDGQMVAR